MAHGRWRPHVPITNTQARVRRLRDRLEVERDPKIIAAIRAQLRLEVG